MQNLAQIVSVAAFFHCRGEVLHLPSVDPLLPVGYLFGTGDLQPLSMLDGLDELAGFDQALLGAGVQPGVPPPHALNRELAAFEIAAVQIRDFQLAADGRLKTRGVFHDVVIVEIQAGHRKIGFRMCGFLFEAEDPPACVEFHDSVPFRVVHVVGEDRRPVFIGIGRSKEFVKRMAVEDVIAEHQGCRGIAQKVCSDQERLGEAVGRGLLRVPNGYAPLPPVAQHVFEQWGVAGGGDDQDVPESGQHQRGQRVIDHGFVEHGQQLLGKCPGDREESGPRAAC